MKARKVLVSCMVIFLALGMMSLSVHADYPGKGSGQKACAKKGDKGFDKKLFCKMHFILVNKDEIGLSDSQEKEITELKIGTKKDLIMKKAEIDVIVVDIKMHMYGDKINLDAVNKLIDKKYDIKKAKAKVLVGASAKLKEILTKDQTEKLKKLCKQQKGCKHKDR